MTPTLPTLDDRYGTLTGPQQDLYRALGVLPVPGVDPDLAAAAGGLPPDEAGQALVALAAASLLESPGADPGRPRRLRFAPGAREHALALAQPEGEAARRATLRRAYEWMLLAAGYAQQLLTPEQGTLQRDNPYHPTTSPVPAIPFADDDGARTWLRHHQDDLLPVMEGAAGQGWHDITRRLADAFWPLFAADHPYGLWINASRIGVESAEEIGDRRMVRQLLLSGAAGLNSAGRTGEATEWYTKALFDAQAPGLPGAADRNVRDEGQALLGLAGCHLAAGEHGRAADTARRAIDLWKKCTYLRGVGLARTLLGKIAISDSDPTRAVDELTRAHALLAELDDTFNTHRALALLGYARSRVGSHGAGRGQLVTAIDYFDQAGTTRWSARGRELLADVTLDLTEAAALAGDAANLYDAFDPTRADRLRLLFLIRTPAAATDPAIPGPGRPHDDGAAVRPGTAPDPSPHAAPRTGTQTDAKEIPDARQ